MNAVLNAARINMLLAPVGLALAAVSSILIARWLGPDIFADYAMLMAFVTWFLLLAEGGCNIGLGRFLKEAQARRARGSLYLALQRRRWALSLLLMLSLIWLGPLWAGWAGLPASHWPPSSFILAGLLGAVMLHGQLAGAAMFASFRHKHVLLINQSMTILRALTLVLLAALLHNPLWLISSLLCVAAVEAWILHGSIMAQLGDERHVLPSGMANAAQKHGLVALFDKMTTALSGGSFLLLVLASAHARNDLAMLAIATDLLQKALGISGLPLSNIALPALNESRGDSERFRRQVVRLGSVMTVLFSMAAGGIMTALPLGLPLLLGSSYMPAVPLAMLWLLPVFFEGGVRAVWGSALIALDQYRWLMGFNIVYGLGSLVMIAAACHAHITTLLAWLGALRIVMSLLLLRRAEALALLPKDAKPLAIFVVAALASALALLMQVYLPSSSALLSWFAGMSLYALILLAALRCFPLIPAPAHDALHQILGKYKHLLVYVLPFSPRDAS